MKFKATIDGHTYNVESCNFPNAALLALKDHIAIIGINPLLDTFGKMTVDGVEEHTYNFSGPQYAVNIIKVEDGDE